MSMAENSVANDVQLSSIEATNSVIVVGNFGDGAHFALNSGPGRNIEPPVKDIKYRFHRVPLQNNSFVDRPSILAMMRTELGSPSNGCRILALKGLGGMGKSQLMLQYCYLHRAEYDFVFWLEVSSWSAVDASFRNLALNLGLDEKSTQGEDSEKMVADWVGSWLQRNTNWLLLLNNADDTISKELIDRLPHIGGDIILTTREPIPPRMAKTIQVDKMQEEEAISLLRVSFLDSVDQDSIYARQIVAELDFMPLAIDLTCAYLKNTQTSFKAYLSLSKQDRTSSLNYKNNQSDYKHTIATVWQHSFDRLRALNPIAMQILEACTFLQTANIPIQFFIRQHSLLDLGPSEPPWKAVREAIAILDQYSFVILPRKGVGDSEEGSESDLLETHRLVQKVIYDAMDDKQRQSWAHKMATALNSEMSFDDFYSIHARKIMDTYIPHTRHFITLLDDLCEKPLMSEDLSSLLIRELYYFINQRIYVGIDEFAQLEFAQLSTQISKAVYGEEHSETAKALHNLGELYFLQGKYDDVESLYRQAMEIRKKVLGSEHPDTAQSFYSLAALYDSRSEWDKAEILYQRALKIREDKLGSEHLHTAQSLNNLALLYDFRGKSDEAESLYKRALAIFEKALGSEHPHTVGPLNNLAVLYIGRSRYDEAEPLLQSALEIREKALPSDHTDCAESLINLALFYRRQKKNDKAEPLFKRALAIYDKPLGLEHPGIIISVDNLAALYEVRGNDNEAEPLYRRALAIKEKTLGSEHSETVKLRNKLTALNERRRKYDEADLLHNRALPIREKESPSGHTYYDKAEPLFEPAHYEKPLGSEHSDSIISVDKMTICEDPNNDDETEPLEPVRSRDSIISTLSQSSLLILRGKTLFRSKRKKT